jgi:hypothetical protein
MGGPHRNNFTYLFYSFPPPDVISFFLVSSLPSRTAANSHRPPPTHLNDGGDAPAMQSHP